MAGIGTKKVHVYLSFKAGIWFARAEKQIARASSSNEAAARLVGKLGYTLLQEFGKSPFELVKTERDVRGFID